MDFDPINKIMNPWTGNLLNFEELLKSTTLNKREHGHCR